METTNTNTLFGNEVKIPARRLSGLLALVATLERKAKRLGVAGDFSVEVVRGKLLENVTRDVYVDRVHVGGHTETVLMETVVVRVVCPVVVLNGWSLVGSVEVDPEIGVVSTGEVPAVYRETPRRCEHCHSDRQRRLTYIVRHEGGEVKQVGSTCLQDFVGGVSVAGALAVFAGELALVEYFEDCFSDDSCLEKEGSGVSPSVEEVVRRAIHFCVSGGGFVSVRRSRDEGCSSTADLVALSFSKRDFVCGDVQDSEVDAVLSGVGEWVSSCGEDDSYAHVVGAVLSAGVCPGRWTAHLVGAVGRFFAEKARREAVTFPDVFAGEIGKRSVWTLEVLGVKAFDNPYRGQTHLVRFRDVATGGLVIWWCSSVLPDECRETGLVVTCKGTVKAHDVYRDVKQTVLTRCANFVRKGLKNRV